MKHLARNICIFMVFMLFLSLIFLNKSYNLYGGIVIVVLMIAYADMALTFDEKGI